MIPKYIYSTVLLVIVYAIVCQAAPPSKQNATTVKPNGFNPSHNVGVHSSLPVKPQSARVPLPVPKTASSTNSTAIGVPQHQRVGRSAINATSHISAESDEEERDESSSETTKPKNPLFRPLGGFRPIHSFNRTTTVASSTTENIATSETSVPIAENQQRIHFLSIPEVASGIAKRSPIGQEVFATTGSSTSGNVTRTHILVAPAPAHH